MDQDRVQHIIIGVLLVVAVTFAAYLLSQQQSQQQMAEEYLDEAWMLGHLDHCGYCPSTLHEGDCECSEPQ